MAVSFSTKGQSINRDQDDENQSELSNQSPSCSLVTLTPKLHQDSSTNLQRTTTTDNRTIQYNDDRSTDEDERALTSHYDKNRLKEERLLLITNIFRFLIVFILILIMSFIA
jgi:hypothetical protein